MPRERPLEFEVNSEAANELVDQAMRFGTTRELLEKLARIVAGNDVARDEHLLDVVEYKHVQQAAILFSQSLADAEQHFAPAIDVFLSYSHKDEDFARELGDELIKAGMTAFLAPLSIKPGATWPDEIWNAVRTCRVFALIATTDALKSKWCLLEVGAAIGLKKTIIAVLRHSAKLPDVLKPIQAVKVQTKKQQALLVIRLKELCS